MFSDQIHFGLYRVTFYQPVYLLLALQPYRKKSTAQVLKRDEKLVCPALCFTSLALAMQLFVIHPMSKGHACPLLLYSPKKVSKEPNKQSFYALMGICVLPFRTQRLVFSSVAHILLHWSRKPVCL